MYFLFTPEANSLPQKTPLRNSHNWRARVLSCFSRIRLFGTPCTVAHQAPLSTGFSRQEYSSALSCPLPGYPPNPGTQLASLSSPALAGGFFTQGHLGSPSRLAPRDTYDADNCHVVILLIVLKWLLVEEWIISSVVSPSILHSCYTCVAYVLCIFRNKHMKQIWQVII